MRKLLGILAAAALVCWAVPGNAELLTNGGFEDGLNDWANNVNLEAIGAGWFWGAGPQTGDGALGAASNWSKDYGTIEQVVDLAPGDYELVLSAGVWVFDNSNDWGWDSYGRAQLYVNTDKVVEAAYSSMPVENAQEVYVDVSEPWAGTISAGDTVKVVVEMMGDGMGGGGWGVATVDNVSLTVVPEPATLGLLGLGLVGLLRRRR